MNVAVLLSGGVDSAVVVHRLKEQGIDPTLFYIRIGMDNDEGDCSAEEDIEMCTYIARKYGLPFEVVSLHREYWDHVMEYALRTVKLGLSGGPWYVVAKDVDTNTIFVSNGYGTEKQYGKVLKLAEFHFITDDPWGEMESPVEITFKNRHTPDFTSGLLIKEGKSYSISSTEPVQGIAPGQFAVVYDKERHICVGSGVITL